MDPTKITMNIQMQEKLHYEKNSFPIQISAGRKITQAMGFVPWHWHEDFELTYLVSGKLKFFINSDIFDLLPGEAVFMNARVLHQIKTLSCEPAEYYSYVFAPEFVCGTLQSYAAVKYILPLVHNRNFVFYHFHGDGLWEQNVMDELIKCNESAKDKEHDYELEIIYHILGIIIRLVKNAPALQKTPDIGENRIYSSMMKAVFYIQEHFMEKITLKTIADSANLSESTCFRMFKRMFKMTPTEYVMSFRINESKKMLISTDLPVIQIALKCGFSSDGYYCRLFKAYEGMTPAQFRKSESERT